MAAIYPPLNNMRPMLMRSEEYPIQASYIQLRAIGLNVLKYYNSLKDDYDDLEELETPNEPAADANAAVKTQYKADYAKYIENLSKIAQIQQDIITTVDPVVLMRNDNSTIQLMLQGIRDHYSLDNEDQEGEIHRTLTVLREGPGQQDVKKQLDCWINLQHLMGSSDLDYPLNRILASEFIDSTADQFPYFYHFWRYQAKKENKDKVFNVITKVFRNDITFASRPSKQKLLGISNISGPLSPLDDSSPASRPDRYKLRQPRVESACLCYMLSASAGRNGDSS